MSLVEVDNVPVPQRRPGKEPLKANVYHVAASANTQLLQLFPYSDRGSIVPCVTALESDGTHRNIGYFVHMNTVDEVGVCFGGHGKIPSGETWVGSRTHGVGGDLDTPFFAVNVITQRQLEEGEQIEQVMFQCEKCGTELLRHTFGEEGYAEARHDVLPTTYGSMEAMLLWNESDQARTCSSCEHVNPQFPIATWGWQTHVKRAALSDRARRELTESTR